MSSQANLTMRWAGLAASVLAAATLQPYIARAQDKACLAVNGVHYNPQKIFDPLYVCYPGKPTDCPESGSVCANHALVKLGNYHGEGKTTNDYQDLIYSPHRGVWGQTYGSLDPAFTTPPGQNTNQAFALVTSFATKHPLNAGGVDFGKFLRSRIVELDITTSGDDQQRKPQALVDHYVTTANTVQGTLNQYMVGIDNGALSVNDNKLEKRDFSASPMSLKETPVAEVTKAVVVDQTDPRFGLITYHDIKSRRGDIQCQTSRLQEGTTEYARHHCEYDKPSETKEKTILDELLSAQSMYDAGGQRNIVIKTTSTYKEVLEAIESRYQLPEPEARNYIKRYMWQPHPKGGKVGDFVQYIHDWLRNAPRSVQAWEMNIYYTTDETNRMFCVTGYDPQAGDYGKVTVRYVDSMKDNKGCRNGPYYNMLHYLRWETGNPNYFGFTDAQKAEGPISGNRANLWLLDTAAGAGTSDRFYRWQMLGSDPTYDMSDPVRYLSYPYVAYQILNGDRMDAVYQVIEKQLYPKWGADGPATTTAALAPRGTRRAWAASPVPAPAEPVDRDRHDEDR